ncbi:ABC transporter ATP-binding protein [Corynebacterium sp. 13CS0277]|uniref:ATP-binding cassette domain-containing protein n=1 Tax=Corynebacterium sp. 13CS0277 TaxID=2071994 RepID=UPI000D040001|nr:ATP-binding cassette domain-containing protein [Corynebacterium sp. 13CS0277]PRQ11688.1 ABC transporter ATP-binding protein [Corynebacterium sp. 13CS0277]
MTSDQAKTPRVVASLEHATVPGRVEDVTLALRAGERLALVGRSGAGKTTTMRLLMGALAPSAGQARPAESFSFIPQDIDASLNPRMTVRDIIAEPLVIRQGRAAARAAAGEISDLVARLGLPADVVQRRPQELSGGQRQRVGIARALVGAPEVVFADEAISALDGATRDVALELFREQHAALVLITHDLQAARSTCEQWVLFDSGRVVETGPAGDLLVPSDGMSPARAVMLRAVEVLGA